MSREIKFRSWNANEKKMITPCMWVNDCNLVSSQMCSAPTHALMQFTGLKDINGVEIYEGDIVRSDYYYPDIDCVDVVKYYDSEMRFSFTGGEQDAFIFGNLEVIGNIHQNPELLK